MLEKIDIPLTKAVMADFMRSACRCFGQPTHSIVGRNKEHVQQTWYLSGKVVAVYTHFRDTGQRSLSYDPVVIDPTLGMKSPECGTESLIHGVGRKAGIESRHKGLKKGKTWWQPKKAHLSLGERHNYVQSVPAPEIMEKIHAHDTELKHELDRRRHRKAMSAPVKETAAQAKKRIKQQAKEILYHTGTEQPFYRRAGAGGSGTDIAPANRSLALDHNTYEYVGKERWNGR